MTRDQLRKRIKAKFGTFTRFCKLSDLDYYEFKRKFLDAPKVDRADLAVIEARLNDTNGPDEFTTELRDALQARLNEYGGVLMFCMANHQFTASTVFQILAQEKESYKRITPTIKRLLDHFNIKH